MRPFDNVHSQDAPQEKPNHPLRTRDVHTGRFVAGVADYGNGMSAEIVSVIEKRDQKKSKDYSGAAVGSGTAVGTVGLIGGGIPGARPNSGRLNQAMGGSGTKTQATRHLVSATRGGVFGYREDAHARYLKNQQERLKGWKPHSRINAFERGREAGKIGPEKTIIRTMRNARIGSNVALGGGAALAGAGLYKKRQNDKAKKLVSKAKQDDGSKFRSDAMISAGVTTTGGSVLGAKALDRQGNKWSARSAADIKAAQKKMPKTGGYDTVKRPKRGTARSLYRPNNRVPDVKPHKSTGTLMWEGKDTFAGRSNKYTEATGRLRGSSGQKRYFAGVYGKSAAGVRKFGIPAGAALTAAGLHHKYYKTERRDKVNKALMSPKPPKPQLPRLNKPAAAKPLVAKPITSAVKPTQTVAPRQPKVKETGIGTNINKSMPDPSAVHVMGNLKVLKPKPKKKKVRALD